MFVTNQSGLRSKEMSVLSLERAPGEAARPLASNVVKETSLLGREVSGVRFSERAEDAAPAVRTVEALR